MIWYKLGEDEGWCIGADAPREDEPTDEEIGITNKY